MECFNPRRSGERRSDTTGMGAVFITFQSAPLG